MLFRSLLTVVLLTPLPLASNRPLAWSLWAFLIGLITIVWSMNALVRKISDSSILQWKVYFDVIVIFCAVMGWILTQALWHPPVEILHPLWGMSQNALGIQGANTLSLTPDDSITAAMRMLAYALTFWLTLSYCKQLENAQLVFKSLMISGLGYCIYGLVVQIGDLDMILGLVQREYRQDLSSTFISRNHFATYAGLTLLCSFALLNQNINTASGYHIGGYLGLQRFIEHLITRTWLPVLAFFIIGTSLLLTHSRGGFFSTLVGLIVLMSILNINRRSSNKYLLLTFGITLLFACIFFYVSSSGLLKRLEFQGLTDQARSEVYQLTWNAIQTNPWLGFGLGSFEEVFPLYKSLVIAGNDQRAILWDYAHNSYLECIFELGLPAALGLFYCFLRLAISCLIGTFTRKRDWSYPATGVAATVLISVHATSDFSIQIPAVPFTYFLLMGAACAQSFSSAISKQS